MLGFGLWLAGVHVDAQKLSQPAVSLPERVEVTGDTISLSDLLPRSASADLRTLGKSLGLGLAPQPGSVRSLTRQQISARLAENEDLWRRLELPAQITVQRVGWPIRGDSVLRTVSNFLHKQGWKDNFQSGAASLQWSGAIARRNENAALQVTGAKPDSGQRTLEVRMRCVDRSLCSSFLAFVTLPHAFPGITGGTMTATAPSANQSRPSGRIASVQRTTPGPGLVERGASAQLKMESGGVQISVPVVCLERGSLGEQIRVRAAGHHVLLAEVVGTNQLRASF
jgi:hypothetical protein